MNLISKRTAFSIIELSVVILLISIIAVNFIQNNKYKKKFIKEYSGQSINLDTEERIIVIYNSIKHFLSREKRLPCAAAKSLLKDNINYGEESCQNSNSSIIPIKTLGLEKDFAEDEFGNQFKYTIIENSTIPTNSSEATGFEGLKIDISTNILEIKDSTGLKTYISKTKSDLINDAKMEFVKCHNENVSGCIFQTSLYNVLTVGSGSCCEENEQVKKRLCGKYGVWGSVSVCQ